MNPSVVRLWKHVQEPLRIFQQLQQEADRSPGCIKSRASDPLKALGDPSKLIPKLPNPLVQPSVRPIKRVHSTAS
ncbi:hypothetical protein [Glycomyces harbinensis]|uniref:Uncharacterized protein n=1 Tax=Glycomyces harbinensis TaxID=58114 RepID=A0A1G6TQQ5_9ACTN|nr:hypothetical protein [Glycomyces harbinensis]SDD31224.1 hypothetical protein SAMN05216270_10392 [Glycomyces harbinensis]